MVALGQQTEAEEEAHLAHGIILAAAGCILIWNTRTGSTSLSAPTRTPQVYVTMPPRISRRCARTARRSTPRIRRGRILGPPTMLTLTKAGQQRIQEQCLAAVRGHKVSNNASEMLSVTGPGSYAPAADADADAVVVATGFLWSMLLSLLLLCLSSLRC